MKSKTFCQNRFLPKSFAEAFRSSDDMFGYGSNGVGTSGAVNDGSSRGAGMVSRLSPSPLASHEGR